MVACQATCCSVGQSCFLLFALQRTGSLLLAVPLKGSLGLFHGVLLSVILLSVPILFVLYLLLSLCGSHFISVFHNIHTVAASWHLRYRCLA